MKQYIEQIFKFGYKEFSGKSNKVYGTQTRENFKLLCDEIKAFIVSSNLKVDEPGVGTGGWAAVPYVRIFDENEAPRATNGVYIVYLFADTENSVFLTLNQGVDSSSKELIVDNRNEIQNKIDASDFIQNNKKIKELRDYGESTIFYKEYKKDALPSEDDLRKDLKTIINVYKNYLDSKDKGDDGNGEMRAPKIKIEPSTKSIVSDEPINQKNDNSSLQIHRIFFGAPGTGKSYKIDYDLFKDENGKSIGKGIKEIPENRKFRTTFHPDYDYAQFVGAYKPKKDDKDGKIIYAFVPQVFAKAYAAAWKLYLTGASEVNVFLVIEEINRGNCAQIFGDIFQLLDRDDKGFSQYSIDADCDFAEWFQKESVLKDVWADYEGKVGAGKLKLPPNLNILATMNTSDQSLFPMDSAFKRRFDWEYVPIRYAKDDSCGDSWNADLFKVVIDKDTSFSWLHFLKKINADIYKATESEDKQMGEFFIKPKNGSNEIGLDEFRSKVLFYLWDSVYKDDPSFKNVFHFNYPEKDSSVVTFQRLFADNFTEILKQMLKNLDEAYKDGEFKDQKILNE